MSDVPTLQEEIERKAFETIEKITVDAHLGRITKAQFAYATDIVWSTVSGLIGGDFLPIMEQMGEEAKVRDGSFYTREFFRSDKGDIARVVNLHDGRVLVELNYRGSHSSMKTYDYRPEIGTTKLANEKFQAICDTLIVKGFEQL